MNVDDIIGYGELVGAEKLMLQKGMTFGAGKDYSILLMSQRANAPYRDIVDEATGILVYEGHDQPRTKDCPNPKEVDQPITTPKGTWTENGRFFKAAMDFQRGLREKAELVKVYEKIAVGVWCYKGFFELFDAHFTLREEKRKMFQFFLKPVEKKAFGRIIEFPHKRLIPTHVKVEVWKRDQGKCVQCGFQKNLHYDHDIPYSKGGSSLSAQNVRILCAKCNLEKSDKIMSLLPWLCAITSSIVELGRHP